MPKIVVGEYELGEINIEAEAIGSNREEWIMLARQVLPAIMKKWPTVMAPQALLLLAARLLSAVIRGCDTTVRDYMSFPREPLLENDIVTAYLRHDGLEACQRLFHEIKTHNLMMRTG